MIYDGNGLIHASGCSESKFSGIEITTFQVGDTPYLVYRALQNGLLEQIAIKAILSRYPLLPLYQDRSNFIYEESELCDLNTAKGLSLTFLNNELSAIGLCLSSCCANFDDLIKKSQEIQKKIDSLS